MLYRTLHMHSILEHTKIANLLCSEDGMRSNDKGVEDQGGTM